MKKLIALVMAAAMLFTAVGALAEEEKQAPLYATIGEAMEDDAEGMMAEADLLALLDDAINAYEELLEAYTAAEDKAA